MVSGIISAFMSLQVRIFTIFFFKLLVLIFLNHIIIFYRAIRILLHEVLRQEPAGFVPRSHPEHTEKSLRNRTHRTDHADRASTHESSVRSQLRGISRALQNDLRHRSNNQSKESSAGQKYLRRLKFESKLKKKNYIYKLYNHVVNFLPNRCT